MRSPFLRRHAVASACLAALSLHLHAQTSTSTSSDALPEVKVTDRADGRQQLKAAPGGKTATGTRLGMLGNTDTMDAAFNIQSYTNELIKDQAAMTLGDVLLNDPSVQFSTNGGHMIENFTVRGFDVTATDVSLNGVYGMLPVDHVPLEFIERVELLKGPNALLGGLSPSGGVGGMINLVSKRATSKPITEVTTSYSSKSYGQVGVDVGRRFGEEGRLGVRFNGAYGKGETGVDDQSKGRQLGALGLDYQGDDYSLDLDVYSDRETINNGSPAMYSMATLGHLIAAPDSSTNMFRNTNGQADAAGVLLRGEYRFTPDTSAYASFGASNTNTDGLQFGTRTIVTNDNGNSTGYIYNVSTRTHARTSEVGVKTRLDTGPVQHQVTLAANVMSYDYWVGNRAITGYAQNIYDPVTPTFPAAATAAKSREDEYNGLAAADTLHFLQDKLLLTLGTRWQRVNQKLSKNDESTVTPAAAIVVKPWGDTVSLYANYIEGLSPGATVGTGYANAGETFAPYKSKQTEAGVKLRTGEITNTFAAFRIEKPSVITNTSTNTQGVDGEQRNQGFEWNFSGQIVPQVTLLGGITWTQAKYTRSTAALTGKEVYGVPKNALTLGADWRTPVPGLSLNGRYIHTGEQWLNSTNTIKLPSWNRVDLGTAYATRLEQTPVTYRAYLENALGKDYWSGVFTDGFAMLSAPRTLRVTATFSF